MSLLRQQDVTKKSKFLLVAMTGGIASGKSSVSNLLSSSECLIIDADNLARQATSLGTPTWKEIINQFGESYLLSGGELDRKKIAELIFKDPFARKKLEAIIHPEVKKLLESRLNEVNKEVKIVIYVVPLLLEAKVDLSRFDLVVSILVDPMIALKRIMNRNGDSETLAQEKINAQSTNQEKVLVSDYILYNNGTLADLEQNVISLKNFLYSKHMEMQNSGCPS